MMNLEFDVQEFEKFSKDFFDKSPESKKSLDAHLERDEIARDNVKKSPK